LAGEREALGAAPTAIVARTAWLYSAEGRNFLLTMRRLMAERDRLTVVADQHGNPTLADDLASAILALVDRAPGGVYHVTNSGVASWFEWATAIAEMTGATTEIVPIAGAEYQRAAAPPVNGAMTSLLLPGLGIALPGWSDALARCLGS
jgi:dTDP-4-dehydrorhamnose reductase